MPKKHYVVTLTVAERSLLQTLLSKGKVAAQKRIHAQILLKADTGPAGDGWKDQQIVEAFDVGRCTVERLRQRFIEHGLEAALTRKAQQNRIPRKIDGATEAQFDRRRLLQAARRPQTLDAAAIGRSPGHVGTGRFDLARIRTSGIKKNEIKPWLKKMWCLPGEPSAEFVCAMEDVLDVYQRPYDPARPQVCVDETSKQLVGEVRIPLPVRPGQPEIFDHEYKRNGTANLFMIVEPLTGFCEVKITEQRTRIDWAHVMRDLVDVHYPQAEQVVLVTDNLNTHNKASLYEAFIPEEAKRIADKLEIHHTPKHGSWLDMAELQLSVLSRQCLDRRIPDRAMLEREVAAWLRDHQLKPIEWRFTTKDARIKLKKLYPSFQM